MQSARGEALRASGVRNGTQSAGEGCEAVMPSGLEAGEEASMPGTGWPREGHTDEAGDAGFSPGA